MVDLSRWLLSTHSPAEEAFRVLATRLRGASGPTGSPGRVLGITSAVAGEGKTVTSINLAAVLVRDFKFRVLYLEADLKRATVARRHLASPGLAEFVAGDVSLTQVIHDSDVSGLKVLTAGALEANRSVHVLGAVVLHRAMVRLRERFDFVIVDCPPLVATSDMRLISEWADRFLLVVRAGSTDRQVVKAMLDGIGRERFLGVVLGAATERSMGNNYGGY